MDRPPSIISSEKTQDTRCPMATHHNGNNIFRTHSGRFNRLSMVARELATTPRLVDNNEEFVSGSAHRGDRLQMYQLHTLI